VVTLLTKYGHNGMLPLYQEGWFERRAMVLNPWCKFSFAQSGGNVLVTE
jgi:hypothetical protein